MSGHLGHWRKPCFGVGGGILLWAAAAPNPSALAMTLEEMERALSSGRCESNLMMVNIVKDEDYCDPDHMKQLAPLDAFWCHNEVFKLNGKISGYNDFVLSCGKPNSRPPGRTSLSLTGLRHAIPKKCKQRDVFLDPGNPVLKDLKIDDGYCKVDNQGYGGVAVDVAPEQSGTPPDNLKDDVLKLR